jgi:hypothetical protein
LISAYECVPNARAPASMQGEGIPYTRFPSHNSRGRGREGGRGEGKK